MRRTRRGGRRTILILSLLLVFLSVSQVFSQEIQSIPLQVQPLPVTLAQWKNTSDDYFSQVKTTEVGYLLWSHFPVKVYLEQPSPSSLEDNSAQAKRLETWARVGHLAISHWSQYLPLVVVSQAEEADILIKREYPPLGGQINPQTGLREGMRARSGQTSYELYWSSSNQPPLLLHKMTIKIHPGLSEKALLAALEHELGHALGIWGHSLLPTDRLYASQSSAAQSISLRDINTLKRIYQQPTRLGWPPS